MLTRVWPALAAWGAGLIHLAVAAQSPLWLLVSLAGLGAAEIGWGILALRADRMPLPAAALASAVALMAVSAAVAIGRGMGWLPLACVTALLLIVAGSAAVELRRRRSDADSRPSMRPGRALAAFAASAALVAALTTPALAATDAGELAVPHGEMPGHSGH